MNQGWLSTKIRLCFFDEIVELRILFFRRCQIRLVRSGKMRKDTFHMHAACQKSFPNKRDSLLVRKNSNPRHRRIYRNMNDGLSSQPFSLLRQKPECLWIKDGKSHLVCNQLFKVFRKDIAQKKDRFSYASLSEFQGFCSCCNRKTEETFFILQGTCYTKCSMTVSICFDDSNDLFFRILPL